MNIDQTTFYSILGLRSNATRSEISKSYKKLARVLHPDKSKSTESEELFKVIVEAHSILSNEQEKIKYDRQLMLNGLYGYNPHGANDTNQTPESDVFGIPSYNRKSQPYEDQPYGFGFANKSNKKNSTQNKPENYTTKQEKNDDKTNKPNKTKLKSFNVKSYQRNQRRYSNDSTNPNIETETANEYGQHQDFEESVPEHKHNTYYSTTTNPVPNNPSLSNNNATFNTRNRDSENDTNIDEYSDVDPEQSKRETKRKETNEISKEDGNNDLDHIKRSNRNKMHKSDNLQDYNNNTNGVPWSPNRRHHMRAKQKSKESMKRSVSPIKMASGPSDEDVISDDWKQHLIEIIDRMNKIDQQDPAPLNGSKRREDNAFDMENINESLDFIPMPSSKRSRTDEGDDGLLHRPVNTTLPRFYKKEEILAEETYIDIEILNKEFPKLPNFQINLMDKLEFENCRNDINRFNKECNTLKQEMLSVYMNRLMFDTKNNTKLVKFENSQMWLRCRQFDSELINKIQALEYKQNMVAQTSNSIISGLYIPDKF